MVFHPSKFIQRKAVSSVRPLLNEVLVNQRQDPRLTSVGVSSSLERKRVFWRWFRDQPELSSPVSIRVNDTIQPVDFFKPDGTALGRNKLLEARKFWRDNFMDERLKSIWFDAIGTGEGFGWKGTLNIDQVKEVTERIAKKYKGPLDVKELDTRLFLKAIDEDLRKPRVFDYVASSTMLVENNEKEVTGYTQWVNNKKVKFSHEEIVHFMFQRVDGKVGGHTPISSLHREMLLLWFIKENMISYVRNGGLPGKIFTMPEEQPNSANHQRVTQILMDQNVVENRNGNIILTGKVDVEDLNEKLRDLEYEKMALWITSNIAYSIQVPVTRIPYLIGTSSSGGDSGGVSDSGYWSMIESDQQKIENNMNTQCLEQLGFIMRFRRQFKLDELRETQALSMRADGVTKLQSIFSGFGQRVKSDKILAMLDMSLADVEKIPQKDLLLPMEKNGLMNQNMMNNTQMEGDNIARRDGKRTEQLNSAAGAANKPGGQ